MARNNVFQRSSSLKSIEVPHSAPSRGRSVRLTSAFQSPGEREFSTPSPSAATTRVAPRSGLRRKECFLECMCTVDTFSGAFRRTYGWFTCGRFYSKNSRGMLTLVAALCAAQRARWSFNRGETARDRKFGRPRTGPARARRGVTRDGAGKRRCELISLFSVRTLFSETLVLLLCQYILFEEYSAWSNGNFRR